ncbi:unnamed protein product [Vitrella brassicaformis CCMP3155]|uniref:Uncharacterized protein n=2 Tax=Vitrella brassicaformis TaxID=1169539 RepID=A0A0G4FW68_VITBC|nr:unnamed protein product [Vitrella brassicaformis CCMP3155]|mmetsp:Transcript_46988/g.117177  ORF Transcript_46988/g.117177 Transcript_46988/m.117177 type:complete len:147 (+) Transcript_46988:92-532(+)|eukprot:CEM19449.1 unnamed protein product [Vitrella brassicaformis CCMP3155]
MASLSLCSTFLIVALASAAAAPSTILRRTQDDTRPRSAINPGPLIIIHALGDVKATFSDNTEATWSIPDDKDFFHANHEGSASLSSDKPAMVVFMNENATAIETVTLHPFLEDFKVEGHLELVIAEKAITFPPDEPQGRTLLRWHW